VNSINNQYIWDLAIRIFHWSLVILVLGSYVTSEIGEEWLYLHMQIGLLIFTLVVFRIIWGFLGTDTACFKNFFPIAKRIAPVVVTKTAAGHSVPGGISVITLLLLTLSQTISGMFSLYDELDIQGPFYSLVNSTISSALTTTHSQLSFFLLAMIALHLIAVFYYVVFKHQSLITPMITGYRPHKKDMYFVHNKGFKKSNLIFAIFISLIMYWCVESEVFVKWITN